MQEGVQSKLQRTFVREEAYIVLRDWIVEGKLEPGQKLRDKELAEQLGVSRTPIREALLRLEEDGFVVTKANSSTSVSAIDFHNMYNLYSIVWSLESLALRQAFDCITQEHIDAMIRSNEHLLQALQAGDAHAALQADSDFHAVYIDLAQNSELCQILSGVKQKLKRMELYYFEKAKEVSDSYAEHARIIKALQQKDLPLALAFVEANWKASFSRIQH